MDEYDIISAQYVSFLNNNQDRISATINGIEMTIPIDPANRHYAAIKAKHDDPDDSFTIQEASD